MSATSMSQDLSGPQPPTLAVGLSATLNHQVGTADSASAWGNGLAVLATPVLLWLAEIACMRSVQNDVMEPWMSVGVAHDATHKAPTPVGQSVTISATLVGVHGRQLVFDVDGHDARRAVLSGRHTRALVHADRFCDRYGLDPMPRRSQAADRGS